MAEAQQPQQPQQPQQASASASAPPHRDLKTLLRESKQAALEHLRDSGNGTPPQRPLVLVMGNGAGDLDSLTSAFSLAYLLELYPSSIPALPLSSPLPQDARYVPLIQTNRSDAKLRPENIAAVAAAGIPQDDILYLSDLTDPPSADGLGLSLADSPLLGPAHNTFLGLVDHPQLELPWHGTGAAQRHVALIVDHHADAGKHTDASLRVFREPEGAPDGRADPTGSAQSIVVDLFREAIQASGKGETPRFDRGLADLAMATVLVDTDNVSDAGGIGICAQ